MASIMVTTYTLKLLDEAEKQAKVGTNRLISKIFTFEINSFHRNWQI